MGYGSASFLFLVFSSFIEPVLWGTATILQSGFIFLVVPVLRRSNFELNVFICCVLALFKPR